MQRDSYIPARNTVAIIMCVVAFSTAQNHGKPRIHLTHRSGRRLRQEEERVINGIQKAANKQITASTDVVRHSLRRSGTVRETIPLGQRCHHEAGNGHQKVGGQRLWATTQPCSAPRPLVLDCLVPAVDTQKRTAVVRSLAIQYKKGQASALTGEMKRAQRARLGKMPVDMFSHSLHRPQPDVVQLCTPSTRTTNVRTCG